MPITTSVGTCPTALILGAALATLAATMPSFGQSPHPIRPPSVPLVSSDPYFSIWSPHDKATDGPTTHWTGKSQRLTSAIRINGKAFRLLGEGKVPALPQTNLAVTPTRSIYTFQGEGIEVILTFTTPLLPDDLMVCSRPVTYVTWTTKSLDGQSKILSVELTASAELAVNTPDQVVEVNRLDTASVVALTVGSVSQPVLRKRGDDVRIDWGHFMLAAPASEKPELAHDQATGDQAVAGQPPLKLEIQLGSVTSSPVQSHAILAYDDEFSIKYYSTRLRPYWRKDGATSVDLLAVAEKDYESLMRRCDAFDAELMADLRSIGGESYVQLGVLAWRQALAAQKICADASGQPLMFSKENFSNGCISTVDVLYPAAPQMLVFAPTMLKASLTPLMDYASSPRWTLDSAPHDLGTYPHATGQVYGGEKTSPMPVEESGNMLILLGALAKSEGNAEFSRKYWPTITLWKNYLVAKGLDPEHQLCTDDFAGHIARNANLSVKAIMGIAAYGLMADLLGHPEEAAQATATARDYAQKWMALADQGDHYALVFGEKGKDTWSQKYNLVWDKLLDLNIFPADVARKEMAFYQTKMNKFGLPLDSRKDYTKLDWEIWTACLAEKPADFQAMVDACALWANETPSRVPLSDWYDTVSGKQSGFQARSVVGGLFIPFLRDKAIWQKYAGRDKTNPSNWAQAPTAMPVIKVVVPAADTAPATWRYATVIPAANWYSPSFDDAAWSSGTSGFGTEGTPGAAINTVWNGSDIWTRRTITLPADANTATLFLYVHHDEDAEIYLNGILAASVRDFTTNYEPVEISAEALATLKPGEPFLLAIHCHQTIGGQYIDAGFVSVTPAAQTAPPTHAK